VLNDLGYQRLLYARVDLVGYEGGWAVMELELVEPALFLSYDETAQSSWPKQSSAGRSTRRYVADLARRFEYFGRHDGAGTVGRVAREEAPDDRELGD
jgi:hypothetical protein